VSGLIQMTGGKQGEYFPRIKQAATQKEEKRRVSLVLPFRSKKKKTPLTRAGARTEKNGHSHMPLAETGGAKQGPVWGRRGLDVGGRVG